jgi:hypothetical protein
MAIKKYKGFQQNDVHTLDRKVHGLLPSNKRRQRIRIRRVTEEHVTDSMKYLKLKEREMT